MIFTTQEELDAALGYWQQVLRLQDWNIKALIVRQEKMREANNQGECFTFSATKKALVHLLDPVDYSETIHWDQDHERVLVHELMHVHMNEVMDEILDADEALHERLHTQEERVVEMAATALIALKRKK